MKSRVVLHLGSNVGNKELNINNAYECISSLIGPIPTKSSLYITEPWGNTDQDSFVNSAIVIECDINPYELLSHTQQIEIEMGRQKTVHWGPRVIDIDIIFFDNLILQSGPLTIPHPLFKYRKFVLDPLMDIVPDYVDPRSRRSIKELAEGYN